MNDALEHENAALLSADDSEINTLRSAILQLPIEYRAPPIMQVLEGFYVAEIARELNLSPSAVLTRLFRARHKLRTLCGLTPAPDSSSTEAPS